MAVTYTYDGEALDEALNHIRFLLGDTDMDAPMLSDQEITAVAPGGSLAQASNTGAAAFLADRLAAKFSRMVTISEGSASADLSQLATHYRALARELRGSTLAGSAVVADAIYSGDRDPAFTRQSGSVRYP